MAGPNLENSCDNIPPDEEPKLKYKRMGNDVMDILLKDSISCITIHPKFVCLGSQWGVVHLTDHEGNVASIASKADDKEKAFHNHTIAVNHISVDLNGENIATCSDDGKVNVHGLYSGENNLSMSLGKVIKSIALDPLYYKTGSGCRFLVGDNRLTLYERTFFNRTKSTTLSECEGYVRSIAWQDRFVAWAGDIGVRVYDIVARCSLGLIKWDNNKSIENFRCNLLWSAENTLMIGWVDTVRICAIRKRRDVELRSMSEYLVDPMYNFQIDYFICGLAPLDNQLIVLGLPKESDGTAQRPVLIIYDYSECELSEISTDSLNINGHEKYTCNDYHLGCIIEENRFFIVSPKEIFVASQYDIDDKIKWLMDHKFYEKAMSILEDAGGKTSKYTMSSVGIFHMDRLLENGDFEKAAALYSKVCSIDKLMWEKQIHKFANINALRYVCSYIPITLDRRLSSQIYEMILYEHLKFDPAGLLRLVKEWDPLLYKINVITDLVLKQVCLIESDKSVYLEILGILYCHQEKFDKALSLYLKLQHRDVFKLIKEKNLYSFIHNKILALMNLDCDEAIALLLDKNNSVPLDIVEEQLKSSSYYLYKYLDALSKTDNSGNFHGTLVQLYAEYDREKLLPFLRCTDKYRIRDALDVCKSREFYPETVYLLGRIGSLKEALDIIIKNLNDVNQAISFCQEHDDEDLWRCLISHSLDKPECVALLLKRIGNYVDPSVLIQGIKSDCKIDNLKDSLGKMMKDFNLQLSVQEACKAIAIRNYFDLHKKLVDKHHQGIYISDEYLCSACHRKILVKDLSHTTDMIVYNCRHVFHTDCLPKVLDVCPFCNPIKLD